MGRKRKSAAGKTAINPTAAPTAASTTATLADIRAIVTEMVPRIAAEVVKQLREQEDYLHAGLLPKETDNLPPQDDVDSGERELAPIAEVHPIKLSQVEQLFLIPQTIMTIVPEERGINDIEPELRVYSTESEVTTTLFFRKTDFPLAIDTVDSLQIPNCLDDHAVKRVVFIVHGFRNTGEQLWMLAMKDALLAHQKNITVVIVGWPDGANLWAAAYAGAVSSTRSVGKWIAEIATEIRKRANSIFIHGIGHSLGAHVLAVAGRDSKCFDRITGLDPAGPYFEDKKLPGLAKEDAKMVDVIHTSGYNDVALIGLHFGTLEPCGTIDFYPNFGYNQPGATGIVDSHSRAYELFTWSIANKGKLITKQTLDKAPTKENLTPQINIGDKEVEMGFHINENDSSLNGLYYIETNSEEPWV